MGNAAVVWVLVVSDVALAVALGWTTWAAAQERLKLNAVAGIRTNATMASSSAWVAGHAAAWPLVRVAAAFSLVGAVAAAAAALTGNLEAAVVIALIPVAVVLVAMIPIVRVANRAARAATDG